MTGPSNSLSGTVIMGVCAGPDQPKRARNAGIVLLALSRQTLERERYRVMVIEQGAAPHCRRAVEPLTDDYLFVYNPGHYNRGWGFNVGAKLAGWSGALCLLDSDLVVPADFLADCFGGYRAGPDAGWEGGAKALKPHSVVDYLEEADSAALADEVMGGAYDLSRYRGVPWDAVGGSMCVDAGLYRAMGGHDERFRGWGKEDKEFWARLNRATAVRTLQKRLVHLAHEPADQNDDAAKRNRRLHSLKQGGENGWPDGPVGDPQRYAGEASPVEPLES